MFKLDESLKKSLKLINSNVLNDDNFKTLIENSFDILTKKKETINVNALTGSKPDTIKEIFASITTLLAQFSRNNFDETEVVQVLKTECQFSPNKVKVIGDLYKENRNDLLVSLGSIGSHFPHITDCKWKIEYKTESNNLEQASGPIFRISFISEVFDEELKKTVQKPVDFTCNLQELQDLVYKLKDAMNHCEKLAKKTDISDH